MIFNIIFTIILFALLITLISNVIVRVKAKDNLLILLCAVGAVLIGLLFGMALSSILFNIRVL